MEKTLRVYICEDSEANRHLMSYFGKGVTYVASFNSSTRKEIVSKLDEIQENELVSCLSDTVNPIDDEYITPENEG